MKGLNYTPASYAERNKTNNMKKILTISLIVTLVLGVSAFLLRNFSGSKKMANPFSNGDSSTTQKEELFMSPLTGVMVKKALVSWEGQRPLGVMVNNHADARPQSGLINADLVYEIVAEGGITRFLAFFLSNTPEKIGPVRSTREYYLVLVKELADAMIMHIGYSPQALIAIETWPVRSLARGGADFWRDEKRMENVAIEHTAYVDGKYLRELGNTLGWEGAGDIKTYSFKDDTIQEPTVSNISIDFWSIGDYSAVFKYKKENNTYLRFMGYDENDNPIAHIDNESGKQLEVKNLIVQFVTESSIDGDEKNRLDYQLVGSGEGVVFIDGGATKVTWTKADRDSRTMFYDTNGNEIKFNRGNFWISIVPDRNMNQVVY
jgi:hypothetical protein